MAVRAMSSARCSNNRSGARDAASGMVSHLVSNANKLWNKFMTLWNGSKDHELV